MPGAQSTSGFMKGGYSATPFWPDRCRAGAGQQGHSQRRLCMIIIGTPQDDQEIGILPSEAWGLDEL